MDPFTLWLLGSVVAPDAYQRVIDSLRADSAGHRLGARVREQVGRFPRATFRKWYSTEATWQELIAGGEQSYTSLVDRLIECSQGRWLRQPLSRPRAEEIVRAAVASFVGSLDPSDAVAVADHRSAERDAAIDSNAEARTNALRGHLDGRLDSIESHLTGRESFEERLSLLPAVVRPLLLTIGASPEAVKLLDIGVADVPREGLVQLTADLPPWLRDASSETLFAAAELCRSYGVHLGAGRLFELAAAGAADRAYCYARSAVEYSTVGEANRSAELIASASSLASTNAVRAIAAALAEEPASVLEALPEGEALADPYFVVLRLYGLRATRQVDEVIAFLESALTCYPESPGLMIELAWALLQRSQGTTTSRSADRHRAIELGLQARQLRRDWRADAADAARVACQAALLLSNYGLVIEIGMPPPDGEAMPMEAANTEVRLSVAQAAIAAGRTELLSTVVELVPDGFHRSIIQAEFLLTTGADIADLQAAYDVVWQTATAEEHRVLYWLSGSAAGVELQGEEEMRARADDVPLMVDSQLKMAQGDHAEAVRLLRQGSRTEQTTRLLVGALVAMDDLDGAVDELRAAATRFNDPLHLVRAVEVLGRGGRIADASQLAQESLHRVPRAMPDARSFLHEVLVEQAGIDESWGEMAIRSRAWIDDLGPSPQNRWHLSLALHNSGDRLGAWRTLQDNPRLRPDSAPRARLWVVIAAHEDPSPDTAREIISLIDEHPDDTLLAGAAVATFFGRGDDVWGDVDAETVRRFQELLTQNAAPYGSDEDATVYVLTGSPEEMLDSLRPSLEANARAVAEMTEKVRQGWPYGLLAAAGNRPYCATLIHRAAGFYPIATTDPGRQEAEVDAARAAIGSTISLDVSGLVIASHTRSEWPRLRGAFARIELARPAQVDILETVEDFRRPSHASVFFDSASQAVRGADTDPEIQARLLDHGEWVLGQVPDLVVVDWPRLTHLSDELDDVFLPWLTPLDMAKSRGLPLWCDDVGLRTLAINDGVPAFGTPALLSVLVERGDFDPVQARAFLRRLREAYAVDLPLDADWLRLSAGSDEWRAGPSAFYFARAAAWVDFHTTYELWSELAQAAADAEPVRVAGWLHAAALGLVSAVDAERSVHVLAGIAAKAAVLAEFDPEAIAACAARVRETAAPAGVRNPVPLLMTILLEHLTAAIGADNAARLLLSEYLDEPDRAVLVDLVFGLGQGDSRLDGR